MKFNFLRTLIIIFSIISFSGCFSKKEEKPTELFVINVLDKNLYDDCHISVPENRSVKSINIPFDRDEIENFAKSLDKNTKIIVYCSNYYCTASGSAAKMFTNLGFKNVWAYEAGMVEWHQKGLPIIGSCKEGYLSIPGKKSEEEKKDIKIISTEDLYEMIYGKKP